MLKDKDNKNLKMENEGKDWWWINAEKTNRDSRDRTTDWVMLKRRLLN